MNNGSHLEVNSMTWGRDTHGLFDYETKVLQRRTFKISETSSIYRLKDECFISDQNTITGSTGSTGLIKIEPKASEFLVQIISEDHSCKMWLVVKEIKGKKVKGYKLSRGDWLKLGRVRLRVQKICLQPTKNSASLLPEFFKNYETELNQDKSFEKSREKKQENNEEEEKNPCRICLSDVSEAHDPLICPCNCSGTMKYIHLNCLKEWLKSKFSSKISEKGMSFHLKDLTCELCKCDFPTVITSGSQKISLLNINFPSKSYIILEEYRPEGDQKQGLHLISLDDDQYGVIGRGHDCDIKISDISVSRKHCKIRLVGSEFYVEDSRSKFGTLAKLKKSFTMRMNYDVTIQINRTVFRLLFKQPWSCKNFCQCFGSNKVLNANVSYLTQSEFNDSNSEQESVRDASRQQLEEDND